MQNIISPEQKHEFYFQERCFITELLNDSDCPGISVARVRVEPGESTVRHIVHDAKELYYLVSGQGEMEIDGIVVGSVQPGFLVHIPAGATQSITNTGKEDLVFISICTPRFEVYRYEEVYNE